MGRSMPRKQDLRAMRAALAGLRGAALNVCSTWPSGSDQVSVTEALEREYPFEQPFDELALELAEWADSAIREIDTVTERPAKRSSTGRPAPSRTFAHAPQN